MVHGQKSACGYQPVRRGFYHAANGQRQRAYTGRGAFHRYFPEGTRSEPGKPTYIIRGIAALYRRIGATVIPVALNTGLFGAERIFKTTWENDYPVPSRHANRPKQETIYAHITGICHRGHNT